MFMVFRSVLFFCTLLLPLWAVGLTQTLVFSEDELQGRLNDLTPIQKQTLYANLILTYAKLNLLEKNNLIEITAFIDATVLGGFHGTGSVTVQGSLIYQNQQGAFYLDQAKLTHLHVDQMNPSVVAQLKPLVEDVMIQSLKQKPIYQLDNNDMRQALLKGTLKEITISNKQLHVTLGF